jgi:photosystem II stability/assembly factor-like uncharacterized protein
MADKEIVQIQNRVLVYYSHKTISTVINKFRALLAAFMLFFLAGAYSQIDRLDYINFRNEPSPLASPIAAQWNNLPDAITNTNFYRRFDWFYRPRLNELGVFPKAFIDEQKEIEYAKLKSKTGNGIPSYQWSNLGPIGVDMSATEVPHWGVISGRTRGLAIHPSNPEIAYIGAASGGIWKTMNGGQTWIDKSGDLNMIAFGSIAIDQTHPDIIYAGTGEAAWYIPYNMYSGDGLYKSADAGEHWTRINSDFGSITHFSDIVVSPHDPNVLMAALITSSQTPYPNQGIWRSTNAGLNWTRVVNISGAFDLAFNPVNPNLVYAATGNRQQLGGFLISTDGGNTFNQSNSGLPAYTSMGRLQFDISQSNPSVLYCLVHDIYPVAGGMSTCAYKSTNGGASWFQISPGVNIAGSYDGTNAFDQGDYDLCISVNPSNPDNVFIGNIELSTSANGSSISFVRKPDGPTNGTTALDSYLHLDVHTIQFAPSDPSVIYAGCDGGVYKSTNSGQTFFPVNTGINSIQLYTIASHPENPDILYGGAQDNGGFSTANRGATSWVDRVTGDGVKCFFDYSNPEIVFIATVFGTLSKSTNGGTTWTEVVPESSDFNSFRVPYWQNPVNPNFIYGAYKRRIYKSADKGDTWSYTTSDPITNVEISAVAQSKVSPGNMILITRDIPASVYRSLDEGYTWSNITANLNFEGASLMNVQADPLNAQTFYLLRGSYTTGQVLKTTDFGNSWTDISSDLPKVPAGDIFVDADSSEIMYLGNDFGVYRTSNGGGSWSRLGNGFPFVPVIEFSYFNHSGTRLLRAGTYGRGVFELNLNKIESVNEDHSRVAGIRAWPNPASNRLWIELPACAPDKYTLTLKSVNGLEAVSQMVTTTGMKLITSIDISGLKPGCYQFVCKGDRKLKTSKVVIMR